jgi:3-hydroxyacyl-[acyl-carrier-protein] dehydratase
MRFESDGRISARHPALPGHFPGHPIVPGVLLLCELEREVARRFGREVIEIVNVKFVSPLVPERNFVMRLENSSGDILRFSIVSGDLMIASGSLRLRKASPRSAP